MTLIKSFDSRLALNSAISRNPYWIWDFDNKGHDGYVPVGRGTPTSPECGKWVGINICANTEGHKNRSVKGRDTTGMTVIRHKHLWCHKATCCRCFIRGFSARGAGRIEARINEGVRRGLGKPEHVMISFPASDHHLEEPDLRIKARYALALRGVRGGGMLFHAYRMDRKRRLLVWSPHMHTLAFINGDYGKCRGCKLVCLMHPECHGFEKRTRECFKSDGCIVKVSTERKTIWGTCYYQLNHSTIKVGIKRFFSVTYFGDCGNRKYKAVKTMTKILCPVCDEEMVRAVYVGKLPFVKDIGDPRYESISLRRWSDENGKINFILL